MRTVRHPITMFIMAVLAVIGIGVGVLAGTGNAALSHPTGPLQTPASILALAKLGTEGTFSAVYQLSARRGSSSSSAKNDVTLTVAQRSPAGTTPSPGRGLGEWSYRLTTADSTDVEWVVHGSSLEDCIRWRSSGPLQCTGPERYKEVGYTTTYALATIPFLPETAYNSISYALEGLSSHRLLAVRLEQSSFGPLTCVAITGTTWCFMRDGRLATATGVGYLGFEWTKYRLVREQATAPTTDFTLSGVPKEPFMLPLP